MEDNSEAAQRRLAASLAKIASGDLDECPVCLETPAAEDARILRCCAAIMCRRCIPSCQRTCPFCRCPFQEGRLQRPEEGESPYTYTTQDYTAHKEYMASQDYSATRQYASRDYSSTTNYTSHSYSATTDYSSTSNYSATTNYSATNDYSSSSGGGSSSGSKYSVPDDKYKASMTDYSSIADKYKAT